MADVGHQETEKLLKELEQRIAGEYKIAVRDMQKKLRDYQEQTEAQRLVQRKLFSEGKITQKEYTDWCYRHMMMGKRWEQMLDVLTKDMHHANEIALKMAKEAMPDVYALNANYATYQIEHDARIDTGFVLYNHDTAEYLLGDERQLMPGPSTRKAKEIAANKDMQWNKQKIQSAVFQGVVQGESPYDVAKRLMQVGQMNYNSAVRYARTMTTSAQNAGRYEAFRRADKLGVDLTIEWQATLDSRTRHEHRLMHGQRRNVDEPFVVTEGGKTYEIKYPADCTGTSNAPQSQIWNCRCTLLSWVKGFEGDTVTESPKIGEMTFEEWQHEKEPVFTAPQQNVKMNSALDNRDSIIANAQEFDRAYHEKHNFDRDRYENMPYEDRRAIEKYTGSSFGRMNRALRGKNRWGKLELADETTQELIMGTERVLNNFTLTKDTVLFRGIGDMETFAGMVGLSEDELIESALDGSLVGMRYCEKGFSSTGISSRKGWSKPVTVEAVVPQGFHGMYVDLISMNAGEQEVLLQHHTWFEILEARYRNGELHMRVFAFDQKPEDYISERAATEEAMRKAGLI